MGKKPMRECAAPGCHVLTREWYCDEHMSLKKERQRIYDETSRDQKAAGFYKSPQWKKAREIAMMRCYGLCQDCLENGKIVKADMVHHIKPLRQHPELALDQNNLRPLCNACHAKY